jgi:hypothetical protein
MNKYLLIITFILFFSCTNNDANKNKNSRQIELIPNPDIGLELYKKKAFIDSTLIKNKAAIRYILIDKKQKPKRINTDNINELEDYETQYFIYKNTNNIIQAITEIPYSQSGDWILEMTHYFNDAGDIYAYEKRLNTFHHADACGEDEALFVKTIEYFHNGAAIAKGKTLKNALGKEFKEDICGYNDIEMPIFKNLAEWSKSSKIEYKQ